MADSFCFPPAPITPHVMHTAVFSGLHGYHTNCPHPTTGISTPGQPFAGDFMGRQITKLEYQVKSQLRGDKIFNEFNAILQEAKSITTFEWKASKCQGKLVPIP
jgi:hypothetical protein